MATWYLKVAPIGYVTYLDLVSIAELDMLLSWVYIYICIIYRQSMDKQFPKYKNSRVSKRQCVTLHALSGVSCA